MARAAYIEHFTCDSIFWIEPNVYVGPDNDYTRTEWAESRVPLPAPDIPQVEDRYCLARDILGREDELVRHYETLIAIALKHGKAKSLDRPFPSFAIKPAILFADIILTEFSWTDSIDEAFSVLEALASSPTSPPGVIYSDWEQHWAIRILTRGEMTYLLEWDCDSEDATFDGFAMLTSGLARQAAATIARLKTIHAHLVQSFGRDYWTHRPPGQDEPKPKVNILRRWWGCRTIL